MATLIRLITDLSADRAEKTAADVSFFAITLGVTLVLGFISHIFGINIFAE